MRKLPEVDEAKALMNEAMDWSVFQWLFEKHRVREAADQANAVLDKANRAVKASWADEIKAAYKEAGKRTFAPGAKPEVPRNGIDPELKAFIEKVRAADDAARNARTTAEATFDEAERQLSTDLAREGCQQAIDSWKSHEKAIRLAEAAPLPANLER